MHWGASRVICLVVLITLLNNFNVEGQSNKVSSKLDFDDAEDKNNTSVPVVPGIGQGRADGQNTAGERGGATGDGGTSSGGSGGSGGGSKTGPKIHGVRVTVDTGDTQNAKESKESVEIVDGGKKHKNRVGIHTDITFEITADGDDDGNTTSSAQKSDKEDASVPIYKGRSGSTHKPRKPYDPKTQWNPNFSSERRGYDGNGRSGPAYGSRFPQYPYNVPVYTAATGDNRFGGDSTNRRGNGWAHYVPHTGVWTTERPYYDPYRPNAVTANRMPSWKPCFCASSGVDNRQRRESHHGTAVMPESPIYHPTSTVIEVVDGKLDKPFS